MPTSLRTTLLRTTVNQSARAIAIKCFNTSVANTLIDWHSIRTTIRTSLSVPITMFVARSYPINYRKFQLIICYPRRQPDTCLFASHEPILHLDVPILFPSATLSPRSNHLVNKNCDCLILVCGRRVLFEQVLPNLLLLCLKCLLIICLV